MTRMPSLFVSHGAPTLAVHDSPAARFLDGFARDLPKPRAVVVASAHFTTDEPTVTAAGAPATIHDFAGFPAVPETMTYPAPGPSALARDVRNRLAEHGLAARTDNTRGLDHGVWVPLSRIYPDADVPVVALSVQPDRDPQAHYVVGQALESLRDDGVLVVGSGAITHNLTEFRGRGQDDPPPAWVAAFADWVADRIDRGAITDLFAYRERGPYAARNHPSPEHILPLFTALGAGGARRQRLHASYTHSVLAMDVYRFDD